jgi:hypothetical protein
VGASEGVACDACDEILEPAEIEYAVNITRGGVFRFHRTCFGVWNHERAWYLERKRKRPFLANAIWLLLESQRGQMFCAQCLVEILGTTRRIDRALMSVEGWGARRYHERCSMCGQHRLVCGLAA